MKEAIDKHFTDFNGFKEAFKKVVNSRFLPGWVWLGILNDGSGKLVIAQSNNEDNTLMMGIQEVVSTPIIGLDMWEHAYYEQHDGESAASYVDSFWDAIDWAKVSENFEKYNTQGQVAPIL